MNFNPDHKPQHETDHEENQALLDFNYAYHYYENSLKDKADALVSTLSPEERDLLTNHEVTKLKYKHYQSLLEKGDFKDDPQQEDFYLKKLIVLQPQYLTLSKDFQENKAIQEVLQKRKDLLSSITPQKDLFPHERQEIEESYYQHLVMRAQDILDGLDEEDQTRYRYYLELIDEYQMIQDEIETLETQKKINEELKEIPRLNAATPFTEADGAHLRNLNSSLSSLDAVLQDLDEYFEQSPELTEIFEIHEYARRHHKQL
ncbi:hypothetical protein H6776_01400 [Candidatus Nomurabacteria bacterium]|nr:hypothetical protein [Candidatus Nomurabacteria bacterium]